MCIIVQANKFNGNSSSNSLACMLLAARGDVAVQSQARLTRAEALSTEP
jgi:hypothetical protein